jgi:hypothetical protein
MMLDERHVFTLRFRDLAERFGRLAAATDPDPLWDTRLCTSAGELVMAAYRAGYVAIPGLYALVEWADGPQPEPSPGKCIIPACPANVFIRLCGFHLVPVENRGDGWKAAGDRQGGVIPDALGNSPALHRPKMEQSLAEQYITATENHSLVCRLLADQIERTSAEDARGLWLYEQAVRGRPWAWMLEHAPGWLPDREQIATVEGVRRAAERYREKHHLPAIPKRKAGRPKNIN